MVTKEIGRIELKDTRGKHRMGKGKDPKLIALYILFRKLQIKLKTDQRAKQKRSFAARKKTLHGTSTKLRSLRIVN